MSTAQKKLPHPVNEENWAKVRNRLWEEGAKWFFQGCLGGGVTIHTPRGGDPLKRRGIELKPEPAKESTGKQNTKRALTKAERHGK